MTKPVHAPFAFVANHLCARKVFVGTIVTTMAGIFGQIPKRGNAADSFFRHTCTDDGRVPESGHATADKEKPISGKKAALEKYHCGGQLRQDRDADCVLSVNGSPAMGRERRV